MKTIGLLAAALALGVATGTAVADECAERFAGILTSSGDRYPAQGRMVTETKGQPTTVNEFFFQTGDHYMFKPVEPADTPWVLTHDGTTYQSADAGATWTKAYSFDKNEIREQSVAMIKAQADSIRNAVCGTEELDGEMLDVLEAEMTNPPPNGFDIKTKYWVRADGFLPKATSLLTMTGFESFVTQTWVIPDELALPIPE